ncbi:MAG: valine--tRNA ligase [Thermoplasmatota archaeon]
MSSLGTDDFIEIEKKWIDEWEEMDIYNFDQSLDAPVYSIDTPPPTISGRMHIGHAVSYTQMDIIARYKRMRGYNVFYPWGWDDNGIATELFVKNETGISPKEVGREKFIELCLETSKGLEDKLERKWKRIGTSADYNYFYRTIDERSRKTSQKSFIDLYKMGREYRKKAPTLWCPHCETAISQVETEDEEKEGLFNNIHFELEDGEELTISTTRPELLPSCVAIFVHPDDERSDKLVGKNAKVPLFEQEVPIFEDEDVDMEKGTGIVMCCTFGDQTDIDWWYTHDLPLRIAIDENGKMTELAGKYSNMDIEEAREKIIEDLKEAGKLGEQWEIVHDINVHERCSTPIEFLVTKQWFIKYLDLKDKYLHIGEEINWNPDHMKVRYDNWVKSLRWDWCISRQRFHGIPFPVWYCKECGEVKLAEEDQLPVNPLVDEPIGPCEECGSTDFEPERDVLDTWATSSLTPQIATRWVEDKEVFNNVFPFSLRPQSHDIITFWAFNTIVKSLFHEGKKPWDSIMIHSYLWLPGGKAFSSSKGIVIDPEEVSEEYGADSLRYLSGTLALGEDGIYEKKLLKRGQRLRTKYWNLQNFVRKSIDKKIKNQPELEIIDKWILSKYSNLVQEVTKNLDNYRYDRALQEVENFLWHEVADHYIEMVKYRVYEKGFDESAQYTLYQIGLGLTKLLAPFMSFITEEVYHRSFKDYEDKKSIHISSWPEPLISDERSVQIGNKIKKIIADIRNWKSENGMPLNEKLEDIRLVTDDERIKECKEDIINTVKTKCITFLQKQDIKEKAVEVTPKYSILGPKYKDNAKEIFEKLNNEDPEKISKSLKKGDFTIKLRDGNEISIKKDEVEIKKSKVYEGEELEKILADDVLVLLSK